MIDIILASGSPRRKELLEQIDMKFSILVAKGEEKITKTNPAEVVEELSLQKASEVESILLKDKEEFLVIGADTLVADGNSIMGKPKDSQDAIRMLAQLQNHTHQVYTGVTCILRRNGERKVKTFHEKTDVTMYPMNEEQIEAYVATGEPLDKAGAYAIQGKCAAYIRGICGDYNNVVGLPIGRLAQELLDFSL